MQQRIGLMVVAILLVALLAVLLIAYGTSTPPANSVTSGVSTAPITSTVGANVVSEGQTYSPANEIANVTKVYLRATLGTFSCSSESDCAVVHTQYCFNNLASQQACINKANYSSYNQAYESYLPTGGVACPEYIVQANVSCACVSGGCSMVYSR